MARSGTSVSVLTFIIKFDGFYLGSDTVDKDSEHSRGSVGMHSEGECFYVFYQTLMAYS